MFEVNPKTNSIFMFSGDCGTLTVKPVGFDFGANDRAVFTVRNRQKTVMMTRIYEITDGMFTVEFAHNDTKDWPEDEYRWDIRYVLDATIGQDGSISGTWVDTPGSQFLLKILDTVGKF